MTSAQPKVVGIGNAVVDIIAEVEDGFLTKHGVHKGTMTLVETIEDGAKLDRRELCGEVAAGLACRAAVKFNDSLPDDEIAALLAWSAQNPEARNCPHGRPVAVSVDLRELENQFQRKK